MKLTDIRQIALPAQDLDRAVAFYGGTLGATFVARFDPPGIAFFDFNGVRLMLSGNGSASIVYFAVEAIDKAVADLSERGVVFDGEPHMIFRDDAGQFGDAGVEEWMVFFTDSEGNTLALSERRA